jgi:recombinational DNA repair protein (RecF pathway)
MPQERLATDAILLTRRDSGEHGLLLTFLSPQHGLLSAFKRTSSRGRQPLPDLFDEAAVTLEKAPAGDLWFVSEYLIRTRRPGIGAQYHSLLYACRYALLLSHHLFEAEEAPLWSDQLRQALDAWESGARPEATYFKTLYLFARHQGIPVKEEWLASKSERDAGQALSVLRQPLAGQTVPPAVVEQLIADFESYLQNRHEVRFGT